MSSGHPVSLVIDNPLIKESYVWFNSNHIYMRAIRHVYVGAYKQSIMVLVRHLSVR